MTVSRRFYSCSLLLLATICIPKATGVTVEYNPNNSDERKGIPLLNFTLTLDAPVPDTDLLVQSIRDYLQVGFLWDVQNVTLALDVEQPQAEEAYSLSSSSYHFGPGTLKVDASMNADVIQQEQISLLQDTSLVEYVLQQDFSNSELQVLDVQFMDVLMGDELDHTISKESNSDMFTSSLSNAQVTLLVIVCVLAVLLIVVVVCLRRYRRRQSLSSCK